MTTPVPAAPTAAMSDVRFAINATKIESARNPPVVIYAPAMAADASNAAKRRIAPLNTAINSVAAASTVGMAVIARPMFAIP